MQRSRPLVLSVLACVLAGGVGAPAAGADPSARRAEKAVYVDGDSLAVGTGLFLRKFLPGWEIMQVSDVSRHASEGASAVRSRRGFLERVVVMSLGANDDPGAVSRFAGYVRDVVRAAGPRRCVIWSTIVRPPYRGVSYDGYNVALRQLARRHANLRVFDWAALAKANPQWFGADGVHATATGYSARAAGLARLIKSC